MIYLDNAATTFPKSEHVYAAMDQVNRNLAVNAGRGSYAAAKTASSLISETKDKLSTLFHANGIADIVFTPSVTHAINQVLWGLDISADTVIYITPYEHNAVARTIEAIRKETGCKVEFIPINDDLTIDIDQTGYAFSTLPPDVVIMNAISNVTGYILPIKEICEEAKVYDAFTVIDAAQAAGLIDLNIQELKADVLCFAGHKTLEGPFGIGGFAIRQNAAKNVRPAFFGGTGSNSLVIDMPSNSPERYEASSPNIVAIAGLNAALEENKQAEHYAILKDLTQYLIQALHSVNKIRVLGETDSQIAIASFVVEGYESADVGTILDEEYNIAVRTGYHCAPYIHKYLDDKSYAGTVRIGLGKYNTKEEIATLISALNTL